MDVLEATRSEQINLLGLESDDLSTCDCISLRGLGIHVCVPEVPHPIPCCGRISRNKQTVQVVGANVFNPEQSQWRAHTKYKCLDDLNGQATKLTLFITMRRRVVVTIAAFMILIFDCEWNTEMQCKSSDFELKIWQGS